MTPDRRILLALFSLALGLRILYAAVVGTDPDINPNPITYEYRVAEKIVSGTESLFRPFSPVAPGYTLFLAGIFAVAGAHFWLIVFVQAVLGGITAIVLYRLGEKCLGRWVGFFSALWFCVYVQQMHFSCQMLRDTLATTVLMIFAYLISRYRNKMRGAAWTGLTYVVLVHVEPLYLFFFPLLAVFFFCCATRHRLLNAQFTFVFLFTVLILSTPWTLRNYLVYKDFVPVSLETGQYTQPIKRLLDRSPGESTPDATGKNSGQQRPGVVHNVVEMWRVVKLDGGGTEPPSDEPSAAAVDSWSLRHNLISLVNYGLLIPFFFIGMATAFKRRKSAGIILTVAVVGYALIRAFYGGSERARLPVEPMLILLAFYGLVTMVQRYRSQKPA